MFVIIPKRVVGTFLKTVTVVGVVCVHGDDESLPPASL